MTLPAEPESAPLLRRILRRWLREHGASEDEVDELTLACARGVRQRDRARLPARGAPVPGRGASMEDGEIVLRIQDWGQWRRRAAPTAGGG